MRFLDVSRVRSTFDEPLIASDGVRLSVDIYRPAAAGSYPALITRTPYDNNRISVLGHASVDVPSPADRFKRLAAQGFVVVACDVRGRGDSDGEFTPFVNEASDGADAVAWVRDRTECDGRIGLFGSGYAGFTALAAASVTAVDAVAAWSPFGADGTPFQGGAVRLEWLFWMHLVAGRTPQPVDLSPWGEIFRHRPLITMPEALGRDDLPWARWLDGIADLQALDLGSPEALAPTLLVTGWWDAALTTTLHHWRQTCSSSSAGHALLIGPWDARAVRQPRLNTGGLEWGSAAAVDREELLVGWFNAHLMGADPPHSGARVFVTGRNEWAALDPLDRREDAVRFWLCSGGRANTRLGDGVLSMSPPEARPPDRFIHNPDEPVPWQLNAASFSRTASTGLALDSSFATERDDVLVYDGEPVARPLLIHGAARATLWVETDAADADWIVAIEDLFPGGGQSVHLAHGIARMGAAESAEAQGPTQLTIELTPIVHELLPGHALRLVVASSLWPLYAVNLGGRDYLRDAEPRISEHIVFHDEQCPSMLEVLCVEGDAR